MYYLSAFYWMFTTLYILMLIYMSVHRVIGKPFIVMFFLYCFYMMTMAAIAQEEKDQAISKFFEKLLYNIKGKCARCKGQKRVRWQDTWGWQSYECPDCNGTGKRKKHENKM